MKLTKEIEERVTAQVKVGPYASPAEVLGRALDLLEQQEADREDVQRAIAEGEAARQRGDFVAAEESRRSRREIIERYRPKE